MPATEEQAKLFKTHLRELEDSGFDFAKVRALLMHQGEAWLLLLYHSSLNSSDVSCCSITWKVGSTDTRYTVLAGVAMQCLAVTWLSLCLASLIFITCKQVC